MEEPEELVEVTVKIPASRIGDFYRVLGLWIDGEEAESRPRHAGPLQPCG